MTNTVILTKILSGSVDILNLCYAVTEVLYLGAEFLEGRFLLLSNWLIQLQNDSNPSVLKDIFLQLVSPEETVSILLCNTKFKGTHKAVHKNSSHL